MRFLARRVWGRKPGTWVRLGLGFRNPSEAQQEKVVGAVRVSGSETK